MLVDIYNSVSLAHLLPIGGEDLDRISGRCQLRITGVGDTQHAESEAVEAETPTVGEVIWADDIGWTCRRWNWRQGSRTRLTEATQNALFLVEGMGSANDTPDMTAAMEELCDLLEEHARPRQLEAGWVA